MDKRGKTFIAPASIWRRLVAFLIDLIIINFVIVWPFNRIFRRLMPAEGGYGFARIYFEQNPELVGLLSTIFVLIGVLVVLYFTLLEYKIQTTPGKMILGLQVVPERKITFWNYLFSNLTFLPVFPFYLLWIIDPIYIWRSPKNQRLMERFNRILVVQKYNYN